MVNLSTKTVGGLLLILLVIIIYFPIFLHLDYMPIRIWDESILGVNALEMAHNHNFIVTYFYGSPDMYRCKPPLMLWVIILFTKIMGFSELSLRLPSALAAAALCMYLFFTLKKITGSYLFGFFAVCVLVTCQGYIGLHITRTGEYDSFWLLFTTVSSLSLFTATQTNNPGARSKHLWVFFIFITLAVLTKGIGCVLYLLPAFAAYVLLQQKAKLLLGTRSFYAGLLLFMVFAMGYYILREYINPGYCKAVCSHELSMGFQSVDLALEGNFVRRYPVLFFLKRMLTTQFISYMFIFPVAAYVGIKYAAQGIKPVITFAAVVGFVYFLVISLVGKKVPHYDAPCIIYMAFIVASFLYVLYTALAKHFKNINVPMPTAQALAFACVWLLLGPPYYSIIKTVYFPKDEWEGSFSETCKIFQQAVRGKENINNCKLVLNATPAYGPVTVLTCYQQQLAEHNIHIKFVAPNQLTTNDTAFVFDSINNQQIESMYRIEKLKHLDYCNADMILVKDIKAPSLTGHQPCTL